MIKGEVITITAACGWSFTYQKGRLARMATPRGRELELVYFKDRAVEMRERGKTLLAVNYGESSGAAASISFNGKRIDLELAEKPRIQVVQGRAVVGGVDFSFHQALRAHSGTSETFAFGVTARLEPSLTITSGENSARQCVWDPSTKLIKRDGEWDYQIAPAKQGWENASIRRSRRDGDVQMWHDDIGAGSLTIIEGGVMTRTQRFVGSGVLSGKIRKVEEGPAGGPLKEVMRRVYDESGRLIGVARAGLPAIRLEYDRNGNLQMGRMGDTILWKMEHTESSKVPLFSVLPER